jgi:hypothetical protein
MVSLLGSCRQTVDINTASPSAVCLASFTVSTNMSQNVLSLAQFTAKPNATSGSQKFCIPPVKSYIKFIVTSS